MGTNTSVESVPGDAPRSARLLDYVVTVGAVIFWLYVLSEISDVAGIERPFFAVAFLCGILLIYLTGEARDSIVSEEYLDLLILAAVAAVLVVASAYILNDYEMFYRRQGRAFEHEYALAWLVIAVILYLTWRSYGNVFLFLVVGTMVYALYGTHDALGLFAHGGISTDFMLQMLITDLAGFYGSLTQLTAVWIAPFLLYAGLLFGFGAFDLILRLAIYAARFVSSGVAQTAVIASAIIGSINGSKAANAGMTGSFTIPTMMDAGLRGRTAAGIEGSASMLGQVLPPVMGAAVFVMAGMLGIGYIDAVIAGLVPAAILICCILLAVHYTSVNEVGSQRMEFQDFFDEPLTRSEKVVEGTRFGIPFLVLIVTLGVLQWSVPTAAWWTVVSMIVLGITTPVLQSIYATWTGTEPAYADVGGVWTHEWWTDGEVRSRLATVGRLPAVRGVGGAVRGVRRFNPVDAFVGELRHVVDGCRRGAIILAPIAIILAAVNGMIDLLMTTGMPSRIAIMLMQLSGGVLLVAVLFGMGVCILMGVGMPTVAAYVIVSTLVAPTFVNQFELPELAAHYMVFYASVLAGVTPPVAVSVVIASGIAGSNFWRTCATAITISAPFFILPVSFVYHPELVSTTIDAYTLATATLVLLGAVCLIYGLNYPFRHSRRRRIPLRFALFWLGVLVMVYPETLVQVLGAGGFVAVFLVERALANGRTIPIVSDVIEGD